MLALDFSIQFMEFLKLRSHWPGKLLKILYKKVRRHILIHGSCFNFVLTEIIWIGNL